jgi:hypothetical protein
MTTREVADVNTLADGEIQYLTEHWNTWHAYRQLFNNCEVEPAHPVG